MKNLKVTAGLIVFGLLGCASPNSTVSTNNSANISPSKPTPPEAPQISPNSAILPVTQLSRMDEVRKLTAEHRLSGVVLDADEFIRNFTFQSYASSTLVDDVTTREKYRLLSLKKYPNDFERSAALEDFNKRYRPQVFEKNRLPDYLIYRVYFHISPEKFIIKNKIYPLEPSYNYWKEGNDSSIGKETRGDSSSSRDQIRIKNKKIDDINQILAIQIGYFNEQTKGSTYVSRISNTYAKAYFTNDEFRSIISKGYKSGKSYPTYSGWSILAVDKKNPLDCTETRAQGNFAGSMTCTVNTNPVKYIIENFNGKSAAEYTPTRIDWLKL